MYEVDDLDRVIALDGIPPSDTGAPLPIVLADENNLLIAYITSSPDPNWDGRIAESVSPTTPYRSVAVVEFELATAHMLGSPNDEARHGHPLHGRGLGYYGAYEVVNSSWIRKLERMNAVHDRHDPSWYFQGKRHFIFTFHDSTFECVARDFEVERVTGTMGYALDRMCEILCDTWRR